MASCLKHPVTEIRCLTLVVLSRSPVQGELLKILCLLLLISLIVQFQELIFMHISIIASCLRDEASQVRYQSIWALSELSEQGELFDVY